MNFVKNKPARKTVVVGLNSVVLHNFAPPAQVIQSAERMGPQICTVIRVLETVSLKRVLLLWTHQQIQLLTALIV
jgi:hypothetical protein